MKQNEWVIQEALRRDAARAKSRGSAPPKPPGRGIIKREVQSEIKSIDEKTRTIWHKITSEVRDRMGDIVRIDGIDTASFRMKPAVLYGHDYKSMNPVPVIGENVGFLREGQALYAGTKFLGPEEVSRPLADLVSDLWTLNKKKLMGWSVGFIPVRGETRDIVEDGRVTGQEYVKTELLEYSNVIIPANAEAVNDAISRGLVSKALADYEPALVPEGPVYYYKLIDEGTLDKAKIAAANQMLYYCMEKLKIQSLDLAWFEICAAGTPGAKILGPRRLKGFVIIRGGQDPLVHLRANLSKFDIQFAAAHECHHQFLEAAPAGRFASLNTEDRENCADAFAWIMWNDLRDGKPAYPPLS